MFSARFVQNDKCIHSLQTFEGVVPVRYIQLKDYLGVGGAIECVALFDQLVT